MATIYCIKQDNVFCLKINDNHFLRMLSSGNLDICSTSEEEFQVTANYIAMLVIS